MLSASERVYLEWFNRMIKRGKKLDAAQSLGLARWMEEGHGRTTWPGWEILIGDRPHDPAQPIPVVECKKMAVVISERRKRA